MGSIVFPIQLLPFSGNSLSESTFVLSRPLALLEPHLLCLKKPSQFDAGFPSSSSSSFLAGYSWSHWLINSFLKSLIPIDSKLISTVCNSANQYVMFNLFPKQIVLNIYQSQSGRDTAAGTDDYNHFRKPVSPKNLQMKYDQAPAQSSSSASNRFSSSFLACKLLILSL